MATYVKLKSIFDDHIRSAVRNHRLNKHYGNDGILAMFPANMRENETLRALPVFTIFLEVLDLVRPDLLGTRLRFFSSLIDELFHHRTITPSIMDDLASWTSPGSISTSNVNPTSTTKPSTASGEDDSDFSYGDIYKFEADKQHLQELRKFQSDFILTKRFKIFHLR